MASERLITSSSIRCHSSGSANKSRRFVYACGFLLLDDFRWPWLSPFFLSPHSLFRMALAAGENSGDFTSYVLRLVGRLPPIPHRTAVNTRGRSSCGACLRRRLVTGWRRCVSLPSSGTIGHSWKEIGWRDIKIVRDRCQDEDDDEKIPHVAQKAAGNAPWRPSSILKETISRLSDTRSLSCAAFRRGKIIP
jgi:hypothetical protein